MNIKNLLLLIVTILLPIAPNAQCRHFAMDNTMGEASTEMVQEYGDTESLLKQTTEELMRAYDFLDMLKQRTEEIEQTSIIPDFDESLPYNLDQIRKPVKSKLMKVLSATRFSDPQEHLSDCQEAITALEQYLQTLKDGTIEHQRRRARAPLAYVPRPRMTTRHVNKTEDPTPQPKAEETSGFNELATAYNLNAEEPAITAETQSTTTLATTPVTTPVVPMPTPAPITATAPIAPISPIKPIEPIKPFELAKPIEPIKPMTPTAPISPVIAAPTVSPAPMTIKPIEPIKPIELAKPIEPIKPITPIVPTTPAQMTPTAPITPGTPIAPIIPTPLPSLPKAPAIIPAKPTVVPVK